MKEKIKVGYIGLGRRGFFILNKIVSQMKDVEITAVCDLSEERMKKACDAVRENAGYTPRMTSDYREILNTPEIDAVFIMTCWSGRVGIAVESMKAGKYTAVEVGCADSIEECYELVDTFESTGIPVMMIENCCYGRREMAVLRAVREGLFGEVVHCTGGYHHYLNGVELFKNIDAEDIPHYRLAHYVNENRENYPTHELGPISKVLNINRGNRMVSLVSVASKACGLKDYAASHPEVPEKYAKLDYKQGDIVTTLITCAGGETVMLCLDTTLPRAYYSRNFSVRGTRGMSSEERRILFFEGMEESPNENEKEMLERYDHPLHAEYEKIGVKEGHGGMDWLVCRAFIESAKRGVNTPIDAYDTAAWLAIGPLTKKSVEGGGIPVEIPDFTRGKWKCREPIVEGKYCLDKVCEDPGTPIIPE